jgi:hypothetical protein
MAGARLLSSGWAVAVELAVVTGLAACNAGHEPERESAAASISAAASESAPVTANDINLQRGFYVSSDVDCGDASNATLTLLRRDAIGGSREICEFADITRTGADAFRINELCSYIDGSEPESAVVDWEILSPLSFRRSSEFGWASEYRYCEQSRLPANWHGIDLTDLLD